MTEIIMYEANDGTVFHSEEECIDYERKNMPCKGFIGYDNSGEIINPKDYYNLDEWKGDLAYLRVSDINGWNEFESYCHDEGTYFYDGLDDVCENGLYYYDEDHDYWENWEHEYEKLRVIRRKMDY